MSRKLFVGNLPYSVTSERLQEAFAQFGTVTSSKVIVDRETGRSRGFAFLEMETDDMGAAAMQAMNGALLDGRSIAVREAVERQPGGGGVARGNPYRADRIRDCHRPGRRRLRREPGAAGRQHYRVHPLRIQHEREMAGTAQRDVSSSSSSSANALPAALTVTMIASRRYLEAFRMFLPLGGTGSRAPVTPGG